MMFSGTDLVTVETGDRGGEPVTLMGVLSDTGKVRVMVTPKHLHRTRAVLIASRLSDETTDDQRKDNGGIHRGHF